MFSKLRFAGGVLVVMLATTGAPASAAKWMVIGSEPDPAPHRSVYVMSADEAWITRRFSDEFDQADSGRSPDVLAQLASNTIHSVIVLQVFENAGGINFISYTVDFKCQEGLVSIPVATSYDRAGKPETGGSPEWMKVPDNWLGKAEMIACGWKNWQSAQQVLGSGAAPEPKSRKKRKKEPVVTFESLGMQYLGEANYFRVTDVIDVVWNTLWTDAVQPDYYEGTAEEKAEAASKARALESEIKSLLTEEKSKIEQDIKTADKIDKKLGRLGEKFFREMQGVDGKSEDDVIALWGIPQGLIETTPGVRQLNYYWSDTETVQVPYTVDIIGGVGNGVVGKIGETQQFRPETRTIQCYRKLFLKEGGRLPGYRVFDFDVGCS